MGNFAENLNLDNRFRPPPVCYKSVCGALLCYCTCFASFYFVPECPEILTKVKNSTLYYQKSSKTSMFFKKNGNSVLNL